MNDLSGIKLLRGHLEHRAQVTQLKGYFNTEFLLKLVDEVEHRLPLVAAKLDKFTELEKFAIMALFEAANLGDDDYRKKAAESLKE